MRSLADGDWPASETAARKHRARAAAHVIVHRQRHRPNLDVPSIAWKKTDERGGFLRSLGVGSRHVRGPARLHSSVQSRLGRSCLARSSCRSPSTCDSRASIGLVDRSPDPASRAPHGSPACRCCASSPSARGSPPERSRRPGNTPSGLRIRRAWQRHPRRAPQAPTVSRRTGIAVPPGATAAATQRSSANTGGAVTSTSPRISCTLPVHHRAAHRTCPPRARARLQARANLRPRRPHARKPPQGKLP